MDCQPQSEEKAYLKLADPTMYKEDAWIDQDGNYYGVDYGGHSQMLQDMQSAGFAPGVNFNTAEDTLVKISGRGLYSFTRLVSPRQRLAIEQAVDKHHYLCEGGVPVILGQYEFYVEGGRCKSRIA